MPGQGVAETGRWMFGSDLRTVGSLHTDIWTGQAADLARGAIAVYPISGWSDRNWITVTWGHGTPSWYRSLHRKTPLTLDTHRTRGGRTH